MYGKDRVKEEDYFTAPTQEIRHHSRNKAYGTVRSIQKIDQNKYVKAEVEIEALARSLLSPC